MDGKCLVRVIDQYVRVHRYTYMYFMHVDILYIHICTSLRGSSNFERRRNPLQDMLLAPWAPGQGAMPMLRAWSKRQPNFLGCC